MFGPRLEDLILANFSILFVTTHDIMDNGELVSCGSPGDSGDQKDDVLREVIASGKRKFIESPGADDVEVGSLSPRKLQITHHHHHNNNNNNDVSFVLIHPDNPLINEDLQNNNDEVGEIGNFDSILGPQP